VTGDVLAEQNDAALTPRERVERMQQANDAAIQDLARRGVGVGQDGLNTVRLALLTQHLLGDMDDERRLAYEQAVQTRFAEMLDEVRAQMNRAVLLQGVHGVPANGSPRG
jgi:hypothetical protein